MLVKLAFSIVVTCNQVGVCTVSRLKGTDRSSLGNKLSLHSCSLVANFRLEISPKNIHQIRLKGSFTVNADEIGVKPIFCPVICSYYVLYCVVQVVTLAVYFYFLASLFGAQWVMPATEEVGARQGYTICLVAHKEQSIK